MTATFCNPILPGSHPDPSIVRVGDHYFLVTSTFEYFPGLPVHHSKDLVSWELIGHVLDRPEQLDLDGVRPSNGLYAPTIRYSAGVFYVVCTLVGGASKSGHFVVTAADPAGPWSNPVWLDDAEGFDPSLFFDDDGRAWFCATAQEDADGHTAVWVQEFDHEMLRLFGPRSVIWRGALRDARWAEAPHIYRIDGRYYLLAAEGGTSLDHAVVVARADEIAGPYEGCPRNPVLTARHLGPAAPIAATGHADLVETQTGEWWAVLLGVRDEEQGNLGRETMLTPVEWAGGWPVFAPGVGRVLRHERRPALPAAPHEAGATQIQPQIQPQSQPQTQPETQPERHFFGGEELSPHWMFVRTPRQRWWSLTERPGWLRLQLRSETLTQQGNPSFVGRRQQHRDFSAATRLDFAPRDFGECAGLAVVHSDAFQLRFEISAPGDGRAAQRTARVVRRSNSIDEVAGEAQILDPGPLLLTIEARGPKYEFRVAEASGRERAVAVADGSCLSYRAAGGFFGAVIGMFATSGAHQGSTSARGGPATTAADFEWFEYRGNSTCHPESAGPLAYPGSIEREEESP